MNDYALDELIADTLHRHAVRANPLPGDPATRVDVRAARRRRRMWVAVAAPVTAAAAVAAFAVLGPTPDPDAVIPVTPSTMAPTPTVTTGRPALDRDVPAAAIARLRDAVHQLTEPMPGRPTALRARLVVYQVDSWRSSDDFTLLVSIDLHFPPDARVAWNEGPNSRFVHFSRGSKSGTYRLEWATGP